MDAQTGHAGDETQGYAAQNKHHGVGHLDAMTKHYQQTDGYNQQNRYDELVFNHILLMSLWVYELVSW